MQPSLSSASPEESKDDVFATITNIVGTTSGGTADGGGGGVDEDASGESASKRIKRTRNRRPASCENCRKKKMRCDRLLPCETCKSRGEEDQCTYGEGAAPLHVHQGTAETAALKLQVDRLQALVDALSRATSAEGLTQPQSSNSQSMSNSPVLPKFSGSKTEGEALVGKLNLKALDICEALAQLTVTGVVKIDQHQPHRIPLVGEARASLIPFDLPRNGLGTFPFANTPDSIDKILALLPTLPQAETVITCFVKQLSWYIYFFPWKSFYAQWATLKEANTSNVDCSFLGVFLAVCGIGLYFLPEDRGGSFPSGDEKFTLVSKWLDAAASALTLDRFLDSPSINAIHAMQLLTAWHVYLSPGDSSSTGFAILNMAGEAVLQLGLHREPDPVLFTPLEANIRRNTFWWTVLLEAQAGASLGKTWSLFQLKQCDAKLPLEIDEKAFTNEGYLRPDFIATEEVIMTSVLLRMRIAIASRTISERAFGIEPVSFSTVLELDRELHKIENSFPAVYRVGLEKGMLVVSPGISRLGRIRALMVNIALLQEYIRLHRPFVASGSAYGVCRTTCLQSCRTVVAIFKELAQFNYGGLTFKAISACCVLSMDMIGNPSSSEADDYKRDVNDVLLLLQKNKGKSRLATNGFSLLSFLLTKVEAAASTTASQSTSKPSAPNSLPKRSRASSIGSTTAATRADASRPSSGHNSAAGFRPGRATPLKKPTHLSDVSLQLPDDLSISASPSFVPTISPSNPRFAHGAPPAPHLGNAYVSASPKSVITNFNSLAVAPSTPLRGNTPFGEAQYERHTAGRQGLEPPTAYHQSANMAGQQTPSGQVGWSTPSNYEGYDASSQPFADSTGSVHTIWSSPQYQSDHLWQQQQQTYVPLHDHHHHHQQQQQQQQANIYQWSQS